MTHDDDDIPRFADDEGHPVAKEGLRSLRSERAPESSVKATLALLQRSPAPEPPAPQTRTVILWALLGATIAAALAYLLLFR